jgi:2-(1,2-epoxy-1,2-dihydrophenyl)acetyl-CoA isomerase
VADKWVPAFAGTAGFYFRLSVLGYDPSCIQELPMPDLIESAENGIVTLTLNRPERLNALSPDMTAALKEALERLSTDRECGAIVITGAGRGWCAGGDVKTMESRGREQTFEDRAEGLRRAHQLPLLLRTMPKVVIASINGPVAGAGLGLALACDLRIAGKSARFGTAFARIGYSGDYGGSWSLTRLVGTAKARELYFTADIIDAEEAGRLGIVNKVVEDDALREETMALARRIADGPRVALGYMKRNLLAAETEPFQTVLELEAAHQARCAFTEDHEEAVAAFNEKRRPVFKGQ